HHLSAPSSIRLRARSTLLPYTTLSRSPPRRHKTGWPYVDPNPLGTLRQSRTAFYRLLPRLIRRLGAKDPDHEYVADTAVDRHHRSEEHTSELQSLTNLVCRLLLAKKTP